MGVLRTIRSLLALAGVIFIAGLVIMGIYRERFAEYLGKVAGGLSHTKPGYVAIIKEIFPISEYNSLRITADCRIQLEDDCINVPIINKCVPTTKKNLLYVLPVTMKLGVDCQEIEIDTSRTDSVIITFPPIRILSTEQNLKASFIHEQDGVLNKVTLKEQRDLMIKQLELFQDSVMADAGNIRKAKIATEMGFRSLLALHPAIPPPSFRWRDDIPESESVMNIETKGEIGKPSAP